MHIHTAYSTCWHFVHAAESFRGYSIDLICLTFIACDSWRKKKKTNINENMVQKRAASPIYSEKLVSAEVWLACSPTKNRVSQSPQFCTTNPYTIFALLVIAWSSGSARGYCVFVFVWLIAFSSISVGVNYLRILSFRHMDAANKIDLNVDGPIDYRMCLL